MPVRVLIVDDSALVRRALVDGLSADPDIEVVGTAVDPYVARNKIIELDPDVLTLDIEMPRMDGLTFLKVLMKHHPLPVIVMSSLTTAGSRKAMDALQAGAVEVVPKPSTSAGLAEESHRLAERIKAVARSRFRGFRAPPPGPAAPSSLRRDHPPPLNPSPPAPATLPSEGRTYPSRALVLIGASTGGTEAIRTVLAALPPDVPGILVVQHIPSQFSGAFAQRLDEFCQLEVREAVAGDVVRPGLVLVAPGGLHLLARWAGHHYIAETSAGPPLHHQRPAVDVLFDSGVRAGARDQTLAAILTGMGADGARGMLALRQAGALTVAQDEESCVVFGMPREAIALGGVQAVLPLDQIAPAINRFSRAIALPRGGDLP